jgi:HSP20 family protein
MRKWDPLSDLISFQEGMDNIFDSPSEKEKKSPEMWLPVVDIYETPDSLIICAEVPGIDISDITIEVKENILFLRGERKFEKEVTQEHYHRMERSYGSFQRSFTLPDIIEPEKTRAKLKDGILKIIFPKKETKKTTRIEVETP